MEEERELCELPKLLLREDNDPEEDARLELELVLLLRGVEEDRELCVSLRLLLEDIALDEDPELLGLELEPPL